MESVLRAGAVYLIVLVLLRFTGRRTMSQMTAFDFVLLLIISETTQGAMTDGDNSLTSAFLLIATFVMLDVGASLWKRRSTAFSDVVDGLPMVVVADGKPLCDRLHRSRIDEDEVMTAARQTQGLERMEQIKYAVLEPNGEISVIPKR